MSRSGVAVVAFLVTSLPLLAGSVPGAEVEEVEHVYLTESEAVAEVFEDADSVWVETWTLTDVERAELESRLGWRLEEDRFDIHCGTKDGRLDGHAIITEQLGLYRPFRFIVKTDAKGEIEDVEIMVYRESRGSEIRRGRFLNQYKGKDVASPLRLNRDIVGITGATVSVRSMNAGVRKVLEVVHMRYHESPSEPGRR